MRLETAAISALVQHFQDGDVGAVVGRVRKLDARGVDSGETTAGLYAALVQHYEGQHGAVMGSSGGFSIQIQDINNLGHRGDVVKVADGYGRNFLLPKKLAMEATAANKAVIEQMKASAVRKSAKEKSEAEALVGQLNDVSLVFARKVGEHDQLFGSVTSADIVNALEAKGFNIDRRKVHLEEPLKQLGEFHIPVKLHREVTAKAKKNAAIRRKKARAVRYRVSRPRSRKLRVNSPKKARPA